MLMVVYSQTRGFVHLILPCANSVSITLMVNLAGSGCLMSKTGSEYSSLGTTSLTNTKNAFVESSRPSTYPHHAVFRMVKKQFTVCIL